MPPKKSASLPSIPLQRLSLHKLTDILAFTFYLVWIIIGLFVILLVFQGLKKSAFSGMLSSNNPYSAEQPQVPAETDLPGIGRVNVDCVRTNLKTESIQKILESSSSAGLPEDENTKLDSCIVSGDASQPSPSPSK